MEIGKYNEGDITDDVLRTITTGKLSTLKSLALNSCDSLTSAGLAFVVSKLPSLTSFNCDTLDDDGLKAVTNSTSRQLRTLRFRNCHEVTDAGMVAAVTSGRLSNLTSLDVSFNDFSDIVLLALPHGCPKLVSLNIAYCSYSATGLTALIFGLRNLRSLTVLSGISNYISEEMMESITRFYPNLRITEEG